eukprot:XP_020406233.1 vegetative cell wall protein gp1-like [Zea mays]
MKYRTAPAPLSNAAPARPRGSETSARPRSACSPRIPPHDLRYRNGIPRTPACSPRNPADLRYRNVAAAAKSAPTHPSSTKPPPRRSPLPTPESGTQPPRAPAYRPGNPTSAADSAHTPPAMTRNDRPYASGTTAEKPPLAVSPSLVPRSTLPRCPAPRPSRGPSPTPSSSRPPPLQPPAAGNPAAGRHRPKKRCHGGVDFASPTLTPDSVVLAILIGDEDIEPAMLAKEANGGHMAIEAPTRWLHQIQKTEVEKRSEPKQAGFKNKVLDQQLLADSILEGRGRTKRKGNYSKMGGALLLALRLVSTVAAPNKVHMLFPLAALLACCEL